MKQRKQPAFYVDYYTISNEPYAEYHLNEFDTYDYVCVGYSRKKSIFLDSKTHTNLENHSDVVAIDEPLVTPEERMQPANIEQSIKEESKLCPFYLYHSSRDGYDVVAELHLNPDGEYDWVCGDNILVGAWDTETIAYDFDGECIALEEPAYMKIETPARPNLKCPFYYEEVGGSITEFHLNEYGSYDYVSEEYNLVIQNWYSENKFLLNPDIYHPLEESAYMNTTSETYEQWVSETYSALALALAQLKKDRIVSTIMGEILVPVKEEEKSNERIPFYIYLFEDGSICAELHLNASGKYDWVSHNGNIVPDCWDNECIWAATDSGRLIPIDLEKEKVEVGCSCSFHNLGHDPDCKFKLGGGN